MGSPLAGVARDRLATDPYPHLVVEDALDSALAERLQAELPPLEAVTKAADYPSNKGYALAACEALEHPDVSPAWRELIRSCISQQFLADVLDLFADEIRTRLPALDPSGLRAGLRHVDSFGDADVLLDAEVLVTTPVVGQRSSSRSPHVDDATRLFNGQLYFRVPEDDAAGGDVELYRFRDGPGGFRGRDVDPERIEPVLRVPYSRNRFLLMLNSLDAVHAVTERPPTPAPRYLLNVIAHVEQPLFDVGPYQAR